MNVIITGGGTGGHLYPALTIAKQLEKEYNNLNIIYIGSKNSIEEEVITKKTNYKFISIDIEGMKSIKKMHENARVFSKFKKAKKICKKILSENNIDFVVGTGGYVCAPVFSAAKKLDINYYIHEQNSVFGKVVKYYLKNSAATFTSFPKMLNIKMKYIPKIIYSGNPQSVIARELNTKEDVKNQVIIYCGSMGGLYFNNSIKKLYKELSKYDTKFIHIVGKNHDLEKSGYDNIEVIQFSNHLLQLINESKFVISRAGASTISELIGLEKPSILVPSPYVAHNHQHYNATYLTDAKCALKCEEEHLETFLLKDIDFLQQEVNLTEFQNNFKKLDSKNSIEVIINKIKEKYNGKINK